MSIDAVTVPAPISARARPAARTGGGLAWARLAVVLDREQGRWFLWVPVFFGGGIGVYFALPAEPPLAFAGGLLMVTLTARILAARHLLPFLLTSAALCMAAGFAAAKIRTGIMAAPILDRRGAYDVEGFVEGYDRLTDRRGRAVLRVSRLTRDGKDAAVKPFRARLSIRSEVSLPIGAYVKLRALLGPPPEPVMPGGYDVARMSYYQGVGASGFSLTKPEIADGGALPSDMAVRTRLAALRARIGDRIRAVLPGQTGAVAAALTVGQEAGLDDSAMMDLRGSGLAHVISISGLHMSLVAGTVFWILRFILALFPAIALRFPVRAIAGGAALFCVTVYLALSGAAVAAVRSYIMIAVVFAAILLNRRALSLRNVALAALAILTVLPDSLIDISFQMSFAATAALIAGYERFGAQLHFEARGIRERLMWQPVYFLAAVLLTTATAGLAVEPFSAYNFHNLTSYAAAGNLLGGPPIDFVVMPAMIAALIAMPFGLDEWPLRIMGYGIDAMMGIAHGVAELPGALVYVPQFPFAALFLMICGGLWLIVWRSRWRLAGAASIGAGLALTSIHDRPDIYVDRDAKIIAVRGADGLLHTPKARSQYAVKQWLRANGESGTPKQAATGSGFRCDTTSCVVMVKGRLVSLVLQPDALTEDCQRAAVLISSIDVRVPCPSPKIILDRGALWENGSSAIYFGEGTIMLSTASSWRGERPWSPPHRRREHVPPVPPAPDGVPQGEENAGADAE